MLLVIAAEPVQKGGKWVRGCTSSTGLLLSSLLASTTSPEMGEIHVTGSLHTLHHPKVLPWSTFVPGSGRSDKHHLPELRLCRAG